MLFNLNSTVRVQVTPFGWERYREDHKKLVGEYPEWYPPEDANGWSEWQLYDLMNQFGSYLYNGAHPVALKLFIEIPDAYAALLAACKAAHDLLSGAWPDPDDDWKSVVFVDDREVVQAQINAAIDLAKPPSSVMAEKGK